LNVCEEEEESSMKKSKGRKFSQGKGLVVASQRLGPVGKEL
jgi:hypothetical protein